MRGVLGARPNRLRPTARMSERKGRFRVHVAVEGAGEGHEESGFLAAAFTAPSVHRPRSRRSSRLP